MKAPAIQHHGSGKQRLWWAVIEGAIADWTRGPGRQKREAERFLFQDEDDFPFVCRSAGLNPQSVRETLWAIRAHTAAGPSRNVA